MIELPENPYDAPDTTDSVEDETEGRAPGVMDWFVALVIGVAMGVTAFFSTCFGTFWVFASFWQGESRGFGIVDSVLPISVSIGMACGLFTLAWCVKKYFQVRRVHIERKNAEAYK